MGFAMGTRNWLKIRSIIPFSKAGSQFSAAVFLRFRIREGSEGGKRFQRLFLVLVRDRVRNAHGGEAFEVKATR